MVHHPPSSGRQIGGVPDSYLQLSDGRELTGGTRIKVGRGVNYDGVATIQALFDGHGDLLAATREDVNLRQGGRVETDTHDMDTVAFWMTTF